MTVVYPIGVIMSSRGSTYSELAAPNHLHSNLLLSCKFNVGTRIVFPAKCIYPKTNLTTESGMPKRGPWDLSSNMTRGMVFFILSTLFSLGILKKSFIKGLSPLINVLEIWKKIEEGLRY